MYLTLLLCRTKYSSEFLQFNWWRRHLVNAYEVKAGICCLLQVKLCDPCRSALKWFVYHARRYTSALLYLTLPLIS